MSLKLYTERHQEIKISPTTVDSCSGKTPTMQPLEGLVNVSYSTETIAGFVITHIKVKAHQSTVLYCKQESATPQLHYLLQGKIAVPAISGKRRRIPLENTTVQLFNLPRVIVKIVLRPGQDWQSLIVGLPPTFLKGTNLRYHLKHCIIEQTCLTVPFDTRKVHHQIPLGLLWKIADILNCAFTGDKRQLYLQAKLSTLCYRTIGHLNDSNIPGSVTTNQTKADKIDYPKTERLLNARTTLDNDIDKLYSIKEMYRRAGLQSRLFRQQFKKLFGIDIEHYLAGARLERVYPEIALGQMPLEEIAMSAGYTSVPNLIVAFRNHFAQSTPAALRKHFDKNPPLISHNTINTKKQHQ